MLAAIPLMGVVVIVVAVDNAKRQCDAAMLSMSRLAAMPQMMVRRRLFSRLH